jgi:hypothetical protein
VLGAPLAVFFLHRQAQLAEQHLADLLGAAHVERLPGQRVGLLLQRHHAFGQFLALARQHGGVDQHAMALHTRQHLAGGNLDVCVHVRQPRLGQHARQEALVHVQRHLAVFAGVFGGPRQLHLLERDLVGALAAHVFVAQALAAEVALGQRFQAVVAVRFQHVALQQRVVHVATHGDAGVGEHVAVVLDVLAQLVVARVLQPRPQALQHGLQGQLLGRAGVAVGQRHVGRAAGLHREADAHDARTHRLQAVGFGVHGHQLSGAQAFEPGFQPLPAEDGFVLAGHRLGRRWRRVLTGRCAGGGGGWRATAVELLAPGAEAVAVVEAAQAVHVGLAQRQRVQRRPVRHLVGQVAVGHHGDQPAPGGQPGQRLAQVLAGHALDAVGRGHHAVQRAEVGDPLRRRLRAHLLDARHVVHAVADEREVVHDALGRHAELGLHAFDVQPLVAHGVDERDPLVHQLRQVLVAGGDDHAVAALRTQPGQRADGVVGLDARRHQHRPAQQLHNLMDGLDLLAHGLGHGRAVGLVLGVPVVAEGLAGGVEDTGRVLGRELLAQLLQHRHHAVDGAGGHAARAAQVGHRVVGAVQVAGAIDQQQGLVRHAGIVAPGRCVESLGMPLRTAPLLLALGLGTPLAVLAQATNAPTTAPATAPATTPMTAPAKAEPAAKPPPHITVLEDDNVRIEESRNRGRVQSITVRSKVDGVPAYQVQVAPAGRDPSQEKGSAGKRTWALFSF